VRTAIVGAGGGTGSSVAFNLLTRPEPFELLLADGRSRMTISHEMDLQQVVAAGATGSVRGVRADEVAGADVVVICAAVPLTVNRSRLVYLQDNAAVVASVVEAIGGSDFAGVLIMVTNPVDPLCTWVVREWGLPRERVIGYCANDTLRLRTALGDLLHAPAAAIDAWVLGEHGDGCVPLLDRVRLDGAPIALDAEQRSAAERFVRGWYVRHVALDSGRSSTWATGHGVARMIAALRGGGGPPWPASVVLRGEYGVSGAAIGVPVSLGSHGVTAVHEWPLAEPELAALRAGAESVAAAAASLPTAARAPR
jgi:malate dehydrogenase